MTTHILLTTDEATLLHTRALHRLTRQLNQYPVDTITDLLHGKPVVLGETHRDAYATYRRAVTLITNNGHGHLLGDEIDGYISALQANDTTEPARLPHAA